MTNSQALADCDLDDATVVLRPESKRRKPSRRLLWAAGGVCAAVAIGGATAWAVYGSPWLRADDVEVQGQEQIEVAGILEAAAVELGAPLASIDTAAVADRVEALSTIDHASVERDWPHTVRIQVTPKVIVATARAGEGNELIAADGSTVEGRVTDPQALPRIDEGAGEERAAVAVALAALTAKSRTVVEAGQLEGGKVRLLLKDDTGVVMWGDTARSDRKGPVLDVLLANPPIASWINLSSPDRPVTLADVPSGQGYSGARTATGKDGAAGGSSSAGESGALVDGEGGQSGTGTTPGESTTSPTSPASGAGGSGGESSGGLVN